MTRSPRCVTALFLILSPLATHAPGQDWPQQFGPDRTGVVDGRGLATSWQGVSPPVAWQADVGFGAAPVVVSNDRVYALGLFKPGTSPDDLTSGSSAPTLADVEKGTFSSAELPGTPDHVKTSEYPPAYRGDLYALCLDVVSGKSVWATLLTSDGLAFKTNKHASTAWELASPLIDRGKLYFHTHTGRVYCLNADNGRREWEVNLFDHRMSTWYGGQQGNSGGPLKVGDDLIVAYEGEPPAGEPRKDAGYLTVGAFDAATGVERWVTKALIGGLNTRTARLGYATIEGRPTVLCSCGTGTTGLDPTSGKLLWSFDLVEANPETRKRIPAKFATPEKVAKNYQVDAMRSAYPGYAPLAWRNYVVDAACVGHNSVNSSTWCVKIEKGRAALAWQTSDFVPQSNSIKSHMVVRDGKLYGFDSHFPRFATQYAVTRPYRGESTGEFQCRDVATGRLLWSSDAFHPEPPNIQRVDSQNSLFLLAGDHVIVCNNSGLTIGLLLDAGVKIVARVPRAARPASTLAEPVLAGTRLFVRQLDGDPKSGLLPALGHGGNLISFDLKDARWPGRVDLR